MKAQVICAGQAVLDCITRGREETPYKPNVYRADSIRLHTGGDAVNEAMALRSLGVEAAVVCGLGDDIPGRIIREELNRAGVDTERILPLSSDTPVANLMVAIDGSRMSVNSRATRLPGLTIPPEAVRGARVLSLASLFRPPLEDPDQIASLVRAAKEDGAIICADTKLPLVSGMGLEGIRDILPLIDYIFPNEKEAEYYTGRSAFPDMARRLTDLGVGCAVIKAGPLGCYVRGQGEEYALPAVPVERVIDTTGAGDNFVAGFISGLLDGVSLRECAARGLRQAARAITRIGGA